MDVTLTGDPEEYSAGADAYIRALPAAGKSGCKRPNRQPGPIERRAVDDPAASAAARRARARAEERAERFRIEAARPPTDVELAAWRAAWESERAAADLALLAELDEATAERARLGGLVADLRAERARLLGVVATQRAEVAALLLTVGLLALWALTGG